MATDRRRAAATATTGATLTVAGGVLRHKGVHAANEGKIPQFDLKHPVTTSSTRALVRRGARGRGRYAIGTTFGLIGAPALAVGTHDVFTRKPVDKRDRSDTFVREGLRGTQDAFEQRAEGIRQVPPRSKAGPLAVSAGSGLAGSLAAHRVLDRIKGFQGARHGSRAGITALAGTATAAASFPLARRTVSNEYEVTPAGVRRRKAPIVRPSSKGKMYDQKRMSRGQYRRATVGDASKSLNPRYGERLMAPQYKPIAQMTKHERRELKWSLNARRDAHVMLYGRNRLTGHPKPNPTPLYWRGRGTYRRGGAVYKVHNPHSLTPVTTRGTSRKVHWMAHGKDHAVCGLDGAFGRGTGPFAEHYGEVTCEGCRRSMKIRKADYPGRRTSVHAQRAAILAAGATPVIGGVVGAHTAGHFAPPGKKGKTEVRQYGSTTAGSLAGGAAGAYGTAALASRYEGVARATERAAEAKDRASERVRRLKSVNAATARLHSGNRVAGRVARAKTVASESKFARPLLKAPVAAGVGYLAGKTVGGYAGSGIAMHRNQSDQREYNLKHPVTKLQDGMTVAERRKLSRKKRYAATSSTATGLLGLGALGARLAHKPDLGVKLLTGGAAVGGVNSLNFAGVLRREAKAQNPDVKKGLGKIHMSWNGMRDSTACGLMGQSPSKVAARWSHVTCPGCKRSRVLFKKTYVPAQRMWTPTKDTLTTGLHGTKKFTLRFGSLDHIATEQHYGNLRRNNKLTRGRRGGLFQSIPDVLRVTKAERREPLTRMRADTASDLVRRHGDAGPLPANLSRPERMQAYEARYVHAGGHKAEHWQRRADVADKVKVAGLAGATAGGAGIMALRHPRVAARLGRRAEHARHATDTATIGAATVSGAGELYAGHARRRRATYSNSKAGVAASALRRMKDYSS